MKSLIAVISLVILLSFPLLGCQTAIVETITSPPSVEEIIENVVDYLADITTLEFDMDLAVDIAGEENGETVDASMVSKITGAVNVINRDGKVEMSVTIDSPGEATIEANMDMYFIDDTMYTLMEIPTLGNISMWVKSDIPPEMHGQMTQVEDQVDLLRLSEVKLIGTETVAGKVCYVLELVPDPDALWEFMSQRMGATGAPVPTLEEETIIRDMASNYSVKQWIAIDNFLLCKAEMDMEMVISDTTMDITMTLVISDYNRPVSIELPPEAEDAIEIDADELPW
jgi:outer membrane lipoprotein-sorting protein